MVWFIFICWCCRLYLSKMQISECRYFLRYYTLQFSKTEISGVLEVVKFYSISFTLFNLLILVFGDYMLL